MRRLSALKKGGLALLLALASLASAGIAIADETPKVALIVTDPDEVGAGTTTAFAVSIKNEANPQQLGSANITVPPGFLLVSASDPAGAGTATVVGSTVELRNLSLPSGATLIETITAIAPCEPSTPITRSWFAIVKQANNFSGAGNDFLISSSSDLTTVVTGTCRLGSQALGFAADPTSAVEDTTITAAPLDPGGPPVRVDLRDADGNVITAPSLQTTVTIAIGTNAGSPPGALSGDISEPTSGGEATFDDLSIDEPGLDYTLTATSSTAGIASGTSTTFDIADAGGVCSGGGGSCNHSASLGSTTSSLTSTSSETGYNQFIALDVQTALNCSGYEESSADTTFEVSAGSGTVLVTITVPRSSLPRSQRSLSASQVCYGSPKSFTPRPGTALVFGGGEYVGLLPECSDVAGAAPCIVSRSKTSKTFSITFSSPTGDPRGRR